MELLTGKCKQDFKKWLLNWIKDNIAWESETPSNDDVLHFYSFPFSMCWGVYQDFFDQTQIRIIIDLDIEKMKHQDYDLYIEIEQDEFCHFGVFQTRLEARKEAILRANTIYNERTN